MSPTNSTRDTELILILITVAGILLLQILTAIACLFYYNRKAKAKWRRLSQQGIVLVHGPAVFWTDELGSEGEGGRAQADDTA